MISQAKGTAEDRVDGSDCGVEGVLTALPKAVAISSNTLSTNFNDLHGENQIGQVADANGDLQRWH